MTEQTRIEWCGNIKVYHPVKQAEVIPFPKPTWQELLDMAVAA